MFFQVFQCFQFSEVSKFPSSTRVLFLVSNVQVLFNRLSAMSVQARKVLYTIFFYKQHYYKQSEAEIGKKLSKG